MSIIKELKMAATDPSLRVSDLLRKALVIAGDLGIDEFREWVTKELNGYSEEDHDQGNIPSYRVLSCVVQAFNPHWGWRPIAFDAAPEMGEKLSKIPIPYSIRRIEDFKDSGLAFQFEAQTEAKLRKALTGPPTEIRRYLIGASYKGIVDDVRNQILSWAMKLEAAGVTGEGDAFTPEEKVTAKSTTSFHFENVGQVTVVGDVTDTASVQIDQSTTYSAEQLDGLRELVEEIEKIRNALKVNNELQGELKANLGAIKDELATQHPDKNKIKVMLESVKTIAEGAASSIIASGILTQISRFL